MYNIPLVTDPLLMATVAPLVYNASLLDCTLSHAELGEITPNASQILHLDLLPQPCQPLFGDPEGSGHFRVPCTFEDVLRQRRCTHKDAGHAVPVVPRGNVLSFFARHPTDKWHRIRRLRVLSVGVPCCRMNCPALTMPIMPDQEYSMPEALPSSSPSELQPPPGNKRAKASTPFRVV